MKSPRWLPSMCLGWKAGLNWDYSLECLYITSPGWQPPLGLQGSLHGSSRLPKRVLQDTGGGSFHFLKAWVQKLAQCHFCHSLLVTAVTEPKFKGGCHKQAGVTGVQPLEEPQGHLHRALTSKRP